MDVWQKYIEMKDFNFSAVEALIRRENLIGDDKIGDSIEGLIQWLAGHAVKKHEQTYVMLHGDIDKAFHAFVLNTKLYTQFCVEKVGFFIHHTPLDAEQANREIVLDGIDYTVSFLKEGFGNRLSKSLNRWVVDHKNGLLSVSAVSCVRNGNDIISSAEEISFRFKEKDKYISLSH